MFKIPQPFKAVKNFFTQKEAKIGHTSSTDHVVKPRRMAYMDKEVKDYSKRLRRYSDTSYRKAPAIDKTFRHKQPKEVNHGHHPVIGLTLAPR